MSKIDVVEDEMLNGRPGNANPKTETVRHCVRVGILSVVFTLLLAPAGCGEEEVPPPPAPVEPSQPAAPKDKPAATVTEIRSSVWKADSLFAEGGSGKRPLSPNGPIFPRDAVHTGPGLKATIKVGEDLTVDLHENATLTVLKMGEGIRLSLSRGRADFARAPGSKNLFHIDTGKTAFVFNYGRVSIVRGDDGTVVRAVAGEIEVPKTKQRIRAGQTARFGTTGEMEPTPGPARDLPQAPLPVIPLTPEALRLASPVPATRGIGTLTARVPGSDKKSETALDLTKHLVKVTIRDGVAQTEIEEAFTNKSAETVEGTFRFLLPSGASITRLALDVNGRIEEGEVLEKKRAKKIFEQIVEDSVQPRDPALLEWERGSSFRMKIFPIKGGETRRVFISYMEPMTEKGGHLKYVYPLGGPAGAPKVGQFEIDADIQMENGIDRLTTPFYQTEVQLAEEGAKIKFAAENHEPAGDFVVQFVAKTPSKGLRIATQTDKDGNSYAMALIRPDLEDLPQPGRTRVVFVLDTSFGVSEEILALARGIVIETIAGLSQDDSFALLACSDDCRALSPELQYQNIDVLNAAHDFLKGAVPAGASNLLGNFDRAFSLVDDGEPATVVYLGDGVPTSGELDPGALVRLLEQIRPKRITVHTVGLGPNVDSLILGALGEGLGGSSLQLSFGESPVQAAAEITGRIHPRGLINAVLQWPNGVVSAYPKALGTITAGAEIVALAKLDQGPVSGDLVLRGQTQGGEWVERTYPIDIKAGPPGPGFIDRLWAKAHLEEMTLKGGDPDLIVSLSRDKRVASRLTSWIVLENQRMYDQFKVERTQAETWDGEQASFSSVEAIEDTDKAFEADAEVLAALDERAGPIASPAAPAKKSQGRSADIAVGELAEVRPPPPADVASISKPKPPSFKAVKLIGEYAEKLRQAPLSRVNHRRYVRLLARTGRVEDAMKAAESWHKVDPLSPGALVSLADQVARTGDRYKAMGLYASVAELDPGSLRVHLRLAEGFRDLGRFVAAAGHYRAAATSHKGSAENWLDYLMALARGGRRVLFDIDAERLLNVKKYRKIHGPIKRLIEEFQLGQLPEGPAGKNRGKLTVEMTLDKPGADLDLSIIDPYGRRISGLWRQGASSEGLASLDGEKLGVHALLNGRYRIIVGRIDPKATGAVSGKLSIRILEKSLTLPFILSNGEVEVAMAIYEPSRSK